MATKTSQSVQVGRSDTGLFWNRATATMTMKVAGVIIASLTSSAIAWAVNPSFADDVLPATDAARDLGSAALQWRDVFMSRNLINSAGYFRGSVGNAITAFATGGQASATALTKQYNFISVCATAADSVRLPTSAAGMAVYVYNGGAAAAQVYGASTDTINAIATGTGVVLPAGKGATFFCNAAGTWLQTAIDGDVLPSADAAKDIGTALLQFRDIYMSRNLINSAGYIRNSVGNALTAFATGGQASALALTKQMNFISTCATAGDSVRLPTSAVGMRVFVYNGGAAAAQVYGASTDTINAVATGTGVPLPSLRGCWFECNAAGTWLAPSLRDPIGKALYTTETNTTDFTTTGAKVAGARDVDLNCTGALGSGQALTLPSAANIVAAIPNAYVGQTYKLRIYNRSSGNFAWTVTTNTGLTLTGTMTIAQNTYREFIVTLTSLTAIAVQSLGQVIIAAV